MEDFINNLDNDNLSNKLYKAINRRHPFANFKEELSYHPKESQN